MEALRLVSASEYPVAAVHDRSACPAVLTSLPAFSPQLFTILSFVKFVPNQ